MINWLINQSVKVQLVANYLHNWLIIKVIFQAKMWHICFLNVRFAAAICHLWQTQFFGVLFGEKNLFEDTNLGSITISRLIKIFTVAAVDV